MILALTEKDFPLLVCVTDYGYLDEWNESMLLSAKKNDNFCGYKAVEEEKILAYVHYSFSVDAVDINSVFVFPDYRKKGLAEKLIMRVIEDAKKRKVDKIFLEVRENNLPALKLYEKLGFKTIGERKKYYNDGENAKIMLKENLL